MVAIVELVNTQLAVAASWRTNIQICAASGLFASPLFEPTAVTRLGD